MALKVEVVVDGGMDTEEALGRYVRERALVVQRLKELSADDWQRTAEHEAFSHYSVHIMGFAHKGGSEPELKAERLEG